MGFSRQEYWSGVLLPSPTTEALGLKCVGISLLGVEVEGDGRVLLRPNGTPLQYSCLENPMDGGAW